MASFSCSSGEIRRLNFPEKWRLGSMPFYLQISMKVRSERLNSVHSSLQFFP